MKALTAIDRAIKLIEAESGVPATDLREARAATAGMVAAVEACKVMPSERVRVAMARMQGVPA